MEYIAKNRKIYIKKGTYVPFMDEKDKKILEILKENSKFTTREIAKRTLIPITTVHKRIKKLAEKGIIRKFTIELDYNKLDRGLAAVIFVTLDYKILKKDNMQEKDLAKRLMSLDAVEKTFHVTGLTDMILIVRVKDTNELESFIDKIKKAYGAIEKTQTLVVLSES